MSKFTTLQVAMDDYRKQFPDKEPLSEKDVLHFRDWLQKRVDKKLKERKNHAE